MTSSEDPATLLASKRKMCQVCSDNPAKYCCPGCEKRTCCLECVKKHKTLEGCEGKRNKTAYVKMKDFTDSNLLSDYRFLEDASRRSRIGRYDNLKIRHDRPKSVTKLIRHAATQGIELRTMPYPMSKRKNNRTFFLYRSKEILWQIEWVFPEADARFIDKKQKENTTLDSLVRKYIDPSESDPVIRHQLHRYVSAGVDKCHLLMKAEGRPANDERFHVLDGSKSITENLQGKIVVEYPSILVVLHSSYPQYSTLSKDEEAVLWQERRKSNFRGHWQGHHSSRADNLAADRIEQSVGQNDSKTGTDIANNNVPGCHNQSESQTGMNISNSQALWASHKDELESAP